MPIIRDTVIDPVTDSETSVFTAAGAESTVPIPSRYQSAWMEPVVRIPFNALPHPLEKLTKLDLQMLIRLIDNELSLTSPGTLTKKIGADERSREHYRANLEAVVALLREAETCA